MTFRNYDDNKKIPRGIRLLSLATALRWMGWGFVEALIPVFLFSFAKNYSATGLLRSVYDVAFLLTLPLASMLADRIASKHLIIIGLIIYPFVGLSYFIAGAGSIVLYIVIARILNGVSYAFDAAGRTTYFRRHAPQGMVASVFGYFETLANFAWIITIILSAFLVRYIKIHWLFLAIVPTSLVALALVARLHADQKTSIKDGVKGVFMDGVYRGMWKEIKDWGKGLRLVATTTFFIDFIATVPEFFIPIYSYEQGASLPRVVLITAVLALPSLLGSRLGKFADRKNENALLFGLFGVAGLLLLLSFTKKYLWQLTIALGIGIALELSSLTGDGLTTRLIEPEHYGRLTGALKGIGRVGELLGPIMIGVMMDKLGTPISLFVLTFLSCVMFLFVWMNRRLLKNIPKESAVQ